jgi:hypothetical protein
MKNIFFACLLLIMPVSLLSQKVTTCVVKTEKAAESEWLILDEQFHPVFAGDEYFRDDSVSFILEANKRYFLEISITRIYSPDKALYSLWINGEPIISINVTVGNGDHFYPFFTGVKEEQTKITGGTDADIADFPWQVFYESGDYLCGGSIINENWVVTAAHCTKKDDGSSIPANEMSVKVGATNPYNSLSGERYYVSDVIVHSAYNSNTHENDIALLKIKGPINFKNAKPIKLISTDNVAAGATDPGVMSSLTGWGLTKVNPATLPKILQKVQLPIVSNSQASKVWGTIPSTDIMAGYLNGNKDACNGDSGGPLVVPVYDEYKLAGIVSWGSSNCDTYGAYTRVSDLSKWIRVNTGIAQEYTPPAPLGDIIICQGTDSSAYSAHDISGATNYEWQLIPSGAGTIKGNDGNALVIWNLNYIGSATILLRVTINNIVSEWSPLDVKLALNTIITRQSGDTVLCALQPVILRTSATGDNLNYTWYQNGNPIQSGLSGILLINATSPDNSGEYICKVSGTCGTVFSKDLTMTVRPLTTINSVSPDTEVSFGGDVTLNVNADGYDLNFGWEKDQRLLDNSNSSQLFLQNLNANDIGLYQSIVKGYCGTKTSDPVYLYVKKPDFSGEPEVYLWPSITSGQFNVALSDDESYTIRIFSITGKLVRELTGCQFQTTIDISTLSGGMYIVKIYNKNIVKSQKLIKTE